VSPFGASATTKAGYPSGGWTKARRNVVERAFNLLKQWRGLATRYDKHAVNYRGAAVLAAILTWLRT